MERSIQRSRPSVEGLEGRTLLNASHSTDVQSAQVTSFNKLTAEIKYATPQGSKVVLRLIGGGSLAGTTVNPDGSLNLVYSKTTVFSTIAATVKGGTGTAALATIRDANVALGSLTGLGGELIGRVLLPSFDLISGGQVNLTSGVQVFTINSAAANSQIHLRDTPLNTSLGLQSYVNTVTGAGSSFANLSASSTGATTSSASGLSSGTSIGAASGSSVAGVTTIGQGTLNPTAVGFGGGSVGAINGAIPIINTVGNGENYLGTPGLTQAGVSQGRVVTYITNAGGGTQLSSISGTFAPGANLIEPSDISLPPHRIPPPGVIVTINHVNGGPTLNTPPLSDAQIYGYDATANALIRFDAVTGVALQSIPLPASTDGVGGITLARDGAELVVLAGIGSNVLAFDALTGAPVGQFSIASLAGGGFTTITGITTAGQSTVLADAADGTNGTLQAINLAQSLATGQAVPTLAPFSPTREFALAGSLAAVPGAGNVFALGSAFFDTTQPNMKQAGILTVTPGTTKLSESARTVLTNSTTNLTIPAGTNNGIAGVPTVAIGSLESNLAIDFGATNGQNVFKLFSPNGLSSQGSFTLNDANPLTALSQSFHPELASTALVDVQGNIQSFTARSITGLVLNGEGNFDQLTVANASNSSIIGLPFSHVNIGVRNNVTITTNSRLVGTRNGVTVNPAIKPVGPLFLA